MPAQRRRFPLDPNSTVGALQSMVPDASFHIVTPSDTLGIVGGVARSLYVGGAGDVVAVNDAGQPVKFAAVPAGTILPIATSQVMATNTTATLIVAL